MKNRIKEEYLSLLDMMKMQFGDTCQVVLYDFSGEQGEIIGIQGNQTLEEIGDPVPEYILEMMMSQGHRVNNRYGFINKHMDGHVLRTSLSFIRDEKNVVGCFCINHNIVQIKMIVSFLEELSQSSNLADGDSETLNYRESELSLQKKTTTGTIQAFVEETVENFLLERVGFRSFPSLEKKEKLILIKELDEKGIFSVKGSVSMVAKQIGVSKFSIYSYLEEIRTSAI